MTDPIRAAAQALYAYCLEELPCGTAGDPQRADKLLTDMCAALSAPQPAADEMLLWLISSGHRVCGDDKAGWWIMDRHNGMPPVTKNHSSYVDAIQEAMKKDAP